MIKKTISYPSPFDETKVITKDYYFNLSKIEILELTAEGDFEERLLRIVAAKNLQAVLVEFRAIIEKAVGYKDGDELIKSSEFTAKFVASPAFDELITELFNSEDQGSTFLTGMLPKDMQKGAQEKFVTTPNPFADEPAWVTERRAPSKQEFAAATEAQKMLAFQFMNEARS